MNLHHFVVHHKDTHSSSISRNEQIFASQAKVDVVDRCVTFVAVQFLHQLALLRVIQSNYINLFDG